MLTLNALPGRFSVCRLDKPAAVEFTPPLTAAVWANGEFSLVLPEGREPGGAQIAGPWRALGVAGTLDFSLIGILAGLTAALKGAGVSVFAVSTYDTDYLLVREPDFDRACRALACAGYTVCL